MENVAHASTKDRNKDSYCGVEAAHGWEFVPKNSTCRTPSRNSSSESVHQDEEHDSNEDAGCRVSDDVSGHFSVAIADNSSPKKISQTPRWQEPKETVAVKKRPRSWLCPMLEYSFSGESLVFVRSECKLRLREF